MIVNYKKYPFSAKIRHHVSAHNYIPASELQNIPEEYPDLIENAEWSEYYNDSQPPKTIDIGCGKGFFLLNYSNEHENKNILGIELRPEAVDWINSVIDGESIPNCRAIHYSIVNGMPFIEDGSIDEIFYLFPDPWPKRRHFKRRAYSMAFVEECYKKLRSGGTLYLATDVDHVHEYHQKILNKFNQFEISELSDRTGWNLPVTNKEKFCLNLNIPVFRLICKK
jgi:tRNA (guanine-N7-)-methyltransferase